MKQFFATATAVLIALLVWNRWGLKLIELTGGESGGPAGPGVPGAPGAPGAQGDSGAPGMPGALTGLGDVAAALQAIAQGVQIPNIQTETAELAAGTTAVVAGEMGKRIHVLAFSVVSNSPSAGACTFWSGTATRLWRTQTANAGTNTVGANLATAWPGHLFVTGDSEDLRVEVADTTLVTVTYWKE